MELQHPVFQDMLKLGCSDLIKITSAYQTYMKLCEGICNFVLYYKGCLKKDKLWDVQYFFHEQLELFYFVSSNLKQRLLHIPLTEHQMSPLWLHNVTAALKEKYLDAEVYIVIKTPDSSLLTYKSSEGLLPPLTPESTKEKKALKEKIQYIQSELNKRKAELCEDAKRKEISSTIKCDGIKEMKMEEEL